MQLKTTKRDVDFVVGYNNNVVALYVTAPDILTLEDPKFFGTPFLGYVGRDQSTNVFRGLRETEGVTYFSRQEISDIVLALANPVITDAFTSCLTSGASTLDPKVVKNCSVGKTPTEVTIRGERVPLSRLASSYVPYSFGCGHDNDKKGKYRVRSEEDYRKMMEVELPLVSAQRKESNRPWNRVLGLFGLYTPFHLLMQDPRSRISALERRVKLQENDSAHENERFQRELEKASQGRASDVRELQQRIQTLEAQNRCSAMRRIVTGYDAVDANKTGEQACANPRDYTACLTSREQN